MPPSPAPLKLALLVCGSLDAPTLLDLASLRAIRSATGQTYLRLLDTRRRPFMQCLQRERNLHRPVGLLHLALPASPAGVSFRDGLADDEWLRRRLPGIRVLLLTDWASIGTDAEPPPWFACVPHIVTVAAGAHPADVAALAAHFWRAIGAGEPADAALAAALAHCPADLRHSITPHW